MKNWLKALGVVTGVICALTVMYFLITFESPVPMFAAFFVFFVWAIKRLFDDRDAWEARQAGRG